MKTLKIFIITLIILTTNCSNTTIEQIIKCNNVDIEYDDIEHDISNLQEDYIIRYISSVNSKIETKNIIYYIKKYTISQNQFNIMIGLFSVESKYEQYANSYLGSKYGRGLGQVSEIALTQYNNVNNTNIKPNDLYDIETNIMISCWLYNYYKEHYNLNDLETCMSYNKGVSGYRRNKSDTRYYDKIMIELSKLLTI